MTVYIDKRCPTVLYPVPTSRFSPLATKRLSSISWCPTVQRDSDLIYLEMISFQKLRPRPTRLQLANAVQTVTHTDWLPVSQRFPGRPAPVLLMR